MVDSAKSSLQLEALVWWNWPSLLQATSLHRAKMCPHAGRVKDGPTKIFFREKTMFSVLLMTDQHGEVHSWGIIQLKLPSFISSQSISLFPGGEGEKVTPRGSSLQRACTSASGIACVEDWGWACPSPRSSNTNSNSFFWGCWVADSDVVSFITDRHTNTDTNECYQALWYLLCLFQQLSVIVPSDGSHFRPAVVEPQEPIVAVAMMDVFVLAFRVRPICFIWIISWCLYNSLFYWLVKDSR